MTQEFKADQIARVRQMATGDLTWDLSDNDMLAIEAVLADRDDLLAACIEAHEWIAERVDSLPMSAGMLSMTLRVAAAKAKGEGPR